MLYALLALAVFGLITSSVFTGMVLAALPRFFRERREAFMAMDREPKYTPPLSLLKPLHGAEPGLESYLTTFFEQVYPAYEILFCTKSADDAGLALAREVAARYPEIPVQFLSTGGQPDYINAKVAQMELMAQQATHDIFVISDSDVRVTQDYLQAVALPFEDPKVGGLTCLYRGVAAEGGLWAQLEAVGMSVEMSAGVLVARSMEGMQFTLGPTMAFRRQVIRKMGGFAVTADYCADDFVLGNEAHKHGDTIVLSHHSIDHMVINASFWQSMLHQVRWMKSTRFSRPKGHFGTSLTFSMPFGLLGLGAGLASHHTAIGVSLMAWALISRWLLSLGVGNWVVRDSNWFGLLVLYPVRDLMGFLFWAASYTSSKIHWRGRKFQLLPGGKMRAA
ncbi:glycosyltransferase [Occallatibacter riparius]|uniref:Glycosyltransferase n=1 Tax=Occallatibacter riparius TaxID=1002689 RepID=A0A9J7BXQ4_9BACT|nr:glycosyltransferase [Occallatibacter riparius]UWZ86746.1 glycosyltransferase [Occallatibacter riparius]